LEVFILNHTKEIPDTSPSRDLFFALEAFSEGRSFHAWHYFGAHPEEEDGQPGTRFRTWAPNAKLVTVFGSFNDWNESSHPMKRLEGGIWECFIPGLQQYDTYKYLILTPDGRRLPKADPYAFHSETRPSNASKLYDLSGYQWCDENWLRFRDKIPPYRRPMNIYECHLGSWRRSSEGEALSYRDTATYLVPYVKEMGFTHVELLPVMEHPLDASWGYQVTGYFAATSRFGTPHDLKYLIDQLHQAGLGVILDWVPAHFPRDAFGLFNFDGTPTYEYSDPRKGEHKDWGTNAFDLGRNEVRSFLFSSAMFWLEEFHADGLRVDAVSSMLYLDYDRQDGQWMPNVKGGNENLEAIAFFQQLNRGIFSSYPNALMIAEESTAWPRVTHPIDEGGLGFNFKWNMGWMNDICHYIKLDPYLRQFNHRDITFSLVYAFSENYVLPLSHDEVVHMKGSFLNKMPGSNVQKFAGVRAFYTYMLTHPGKKLTFMGTELGQWGEWNYEYSLDWHLLQYLPHRQLQVFFQTINTLYLAQPALWEQDDSWEGFQWLCADDNHGNTVAFLRWDSTGRPLVVICNFSPIHRDGYRIGVPFPGIYQILMNTDSTQFGGSGLGDTTPLRSEAVPCHEQEQSISINLPPMSSVIYRCARKSPRRQKTDAKAHPSAKTAAAPKKQLAKKAAAPRRAGAKKKSAAKPT